MRLLFDRLVGVVWTVFAALTIVFAVVISVVRIALPAVDQQRPAIESWLSEFIGLPLIIGEVDASWRGWMPTIQVEELVLMDAAGVNELVRFDSAEVDISPSDSLKQLSLQPRRLVVRGMRIALERDAEGRISIAGMPPSRWPVAQWILQQENFILTDADVSFTDRSTGQPTVVFNDVVFSVSRDAEYQLIQGRLQRQDSGGEEYNFALHADGDVLGEDWAGKLFVEVNNADPRSILALAGTPVDSDVSGRLHARIWSIWKGAVMHRAALEISGAITQGSAAGARSTADVGASGLALRLVDGWAFEFDRLRVAFPDEPAAESRLAVRWRARGKAVPFIGFSGENVNLQHLARFVNASDGAGKLFPAGALGIATEGVFEEIAGGIQRETTTLPRYYLEGKIIDLAVTGTPRWPQVRGLDFSFRMNKQGGTIRAASAGGVTVAGETFLAAPIAIEELVGAVSWSLAPEELLIRTEALEIHAESFDFTAGGSLSVKPHASPHINLVTEINSGDLVRLGSLIPLDKLPPRGDAWLRTAFKAGHFAPSRIVLHGKLSDFPFDNGNGMVRGNFEVRGVDLKYGANWPMATAIDATISVENRHAKTLVHEGRVYSAEIGGSTIEMPDLFSRKPVVRIQGKTRVVPGELGNFIAASPLGKTKAQRYSEIAITNDFDMTLDINLNLYPGGGSDVLGLVHFSGNRISHGVQQITLEDVSGDISFTRQDWYGEGLTATFAGDRVGVVLNGGLDDPNYDTEFRMTGSSDAAQLQRYIERYAPQLGSLLKSGADQQSLDGKLPWKAVMTIPEAANDGKQGPKRLSFESSLMGLTVDLPWPFGKTSAEQKPLALTTTTGASGDRLVRVSYGDTVAVEFDQAKRADGSFTTRRAEFVFGDPSPTFKGDPGLLARGRIGRLPLNDWVKFARTATAATDGARTELPVSVDVLVENLEAFGHTFAATQLTGTKDATEWKLSLTGPQVLGRIAFPHGSPAPTLLLDFERLWLRKSTAVSSASNMDPRRIPSLRFSADSLHFGDIDLGQATLIASHEAQGLNIERLKLSQENFELSGHGNWQLAGEVHQSQVELTVKGDSLAGLLESFNYSVANIDGGKTDIAITAAWGGTPSEFRLDKLHGQFTLKVEEGRFLDIEPGGGRLFGLLSLQTLPRRLSFDFNDLFSKGFAFDTIEGTFELDSGNAYTNSLLMNGPSARINVSGRTGLKDQDYDQLVTVTPALSSTIPVASALFGPAGIGVGAVIYLGQKMFKSIPEQVDKFLSREYSITGAWKQPVIERI